MTNNELTLDQLQAVSGGAAFIKFGDIRGEYLQVNGKAGVECKVPPSFKKPQDKINNASDDAGGVVESLRSDNRF